MNITHTDISAWLNEKAKALGVDLVGCQAGPGRAPFFSATAGGAVKVGDTPEQAAATLTPQAVLADKERRREELDREIETLRWSLEKVAIRKGAA